MSDGRDEFARPVGELLGEILRLVFWVIRLMFYLLRWMCGLSPRQRANRRAQARERASRRQRDEWVKRVREQNARGSARDATEAEAQAALRGRGGRRSPLDDRKF
jgi:hypothetical protein